MKKTVFAANTIFIVLFALANKCDKSASNIPTDVNNDYHVSPVQSGQSGLPAQPARPTHDKEDNTVETNICQICGNRFTGNGYTEVAHGQWQEAKEPYQSYICSRLCGMQHTKNWEIRLQELRSNGNSNTPAQGHRAEINEQNYSDDPCGLCGGTGIESNRYGDARVCPMCDGSGKRKN